MEGKQLNALSVKGGPHSRIAKDIHLNFALVPINGIQIVIVAGMTTDFRPAIRQLGKNLEQVFHRDAVGKRLTLASLAIKIAAETHGFAAVAKGHTDLFCNVEQGGPGWLVAMDVLMRINMSRSFP